MDTNCHIRFENHCCVSGPVCWNALPPSLESPSFKPREFCADLKRTIMVQPCKFVLLDFALRKELCINISINIAPLAGFCASTLCPPQLIFRSRAHGATFGWKLLRSFYRTMYRASRSMCSHAVDLSVGRSVGRSIDRSIDRSTTTR